MSTLTRSRPFLIALAVLIAVWLLAAVSLAIV